MERRNGAFKKLRVGSCEASKGPVGSKPWILPSSQHAFFSMLCCLLFNLWGCVYLALCCYKEVSLALGLQDRDLESVSKGESLFQR